MRSMHSSRLLGSDPLKLLANVVVFIGVRKPVTASIKENMTTKPRKRFAIIFLARRYITPAPKRPTSGAART